MFASTVEALRPKVQSQPVLGMEESWKGVSSHMPHGRWEKYAWRQNTITEEVPVGGLGWASLCPCDVLSGCDGAQPLSRREQNRMGCAIMPVPFLGIRWAR